MIPGMIPRMPPPSILSTVTRCFSSDSLGTGDTWFFIAAMDLNIMSISERERERGWTSLQAYWYSETLVFMARFDEENLYI